jgi:DNA-binding PadR family transcriptional regulator
MEIHSEIVESLPLTETTYFILLSLAVEPSHGYRIMKDVEALSDERVSLSTGTLYGALRRLLEQGWIERIPASNVGEKTDERKRKFYQLTEKGRLVLEAEVSRLSELLQAARIRRVETLP